MAQVLDTDVVVRGGQSPLPEPGTIFSGSHGPTLENAASGVVHGTIRAATAGALRAAGGTVEAVPEAAYPGGPVNERHVHVIEGRAQPFLVTSSPILFQSRAALRESQ